MTQAIQASPLFSSDTTGVVFLPFASSGGLTAGYACYPVVVARNSEIESITPARAYGVHIRDRIERLQTNPKRAASLAKARARIGNWMASEAAGQSSNGLAALRLKAGLSQAQLAAKLRTSQPNIARMEKGGGNHTLALLRAWADALGVTPNELFAAFDATDGAGKQVHQDS